MNKTNVTAPLSSRREVETSGSGTVKAWREIVTIPTYEVGKAEKSPMFLEKRVYQGSSGVVYPYPVIESIANEPTPREWNVVYLENEYIKVMVMPELGGRIQMAYDKIRQRHFVYYNHVIKPALVGLAGPWISGGIEFNWPQHHRPSTYMPVDCDIVENADGSVTVWVNEMERMFHQKGMAGFTLRPGCAYLEIQGRVSNRTPLPQTFLWWANPAVEVNDDYQSVFPPDINAVFDHGKRAVSSFPIATGTYYKMDYSAGVDISNYRNIKVPTSYMAVNSKYDFEGGYENDTQAGMLHVASHHFSPGKKQWTWGNGDFGRAWDRNLTDDATATDGLPAGSIREGFRPYIELMAGVYTENQPDFTWLMPYEEKQFVQYFMPYRELGVVKQATKDFVMNVCAAEGGVLLKVMATSRQCARIVVRNDNGEEYYNKEVELSPENVFAETIDVGECALSRLTVSVGTLTWHAEPDEIRPVPDAAEAALPPADTKTNDQLYLTGLHLEQYRHATWSALDYYEEALRRDPRDVRCLNQAGLWYLRRGRFGKAEAYLRQAVKIWQKRNPNPYDSEAIFNLALALKYKSLTHGASQRDEAYGLFWKSTWSKAWADAGYFEAACISVGDGRYDDALDELNRALIFNSCNHKARALKAAVLRLLGRKDEALAWIEESYRLDRFNYGCMYEEHLLTGRSADHIQELMHGSVYNYHELALDYAQAGLWQECADVLQMAEEQHPLTYYYIGYAKAMAGETDEGKAWMQKAETTAPDYCFPNRLEDVVALELAKALNPGGARAPYYLGCLYYDKRQYDLAVENWELSARLDPQFPTVWRNLALACFNKGLTSAAISSEEDKGRLAVEYMERAFSLDEDDARMLMELDQLRRRVQKPHEERLALLQRHPQLIERRDDLVLEEITLLNQLGHYEEAMHKLDAHIFHPWEGGEGKVSGQYQISRVELAKKRLSLAPSHDARAIDEAVSLLSQCLEYPHSLGEGKLYGAQENDFYYFLGLACDMKGDNEKAREYWEEATKGPQEPAAAMYYNDAKPDKIFYQGLALLKLGRKGEANGRFYKLVNYGKQHIFDHVVMDYFAVSLPDLLIWEGSGEHQLSELDVKNRIHCLYMLALGYCGLGDREHALRYLCEVEKLDVNHYGTQALRSLLSSSSVLLPSGLGCRA
jgi:tetratricopeptide (TPR) repeat protein